MNAAADVAKPLKTWSHLAKNKRRPTEYETVSTNLLWSTKQPEAPWLLGPDIALSKWYVAYRSKSQWQHQDWDAFRDPDQLVYRTYNTIQDGQEAYVDGLLDDHDRNDHDFGLPADWMPILAGYHTPGRYLIHAAQMSSNYLVALAPASTICNCFMFQAGDQLRWVSRIAYRTAELASRQSSTVFGKSERQHWERDPQWQGFRELMERLLVTWDWAEQFFALNVIAKPAIDAAYLRQFGFHARRSGDALTGLLADAQLIDSERTKRWTRALVEHAYTSRLADNRQVASGWAAKWVPLGERAMEAFLMSMPNGESMLAAAKHETGLFRIALGLSA
jgi:toluene monooxygenase system protein E